MVKILENLIKMDDLGGFPTIFGSTPIFEYGCPSKIRGVLYTQIIHLFIGLSMKNSPSILGYHYFWKHLFLAGEEEVTMVTKNLCVTHRMRMPYAQLGSVGNPSAGGAISLPMVGSPKSLCRI